jgi:hypothetical protein
MDHDPALFWFVQAIIAILVLAALAMAWVHRND